MPSKLFLSGLALALCQGAFAQSPPPAPQSAPLRLTLDDAMARARANSPQILSANIATLLAREDTVQAKAALLPEASSFNQFIYTQPNGTPSGVFVSNDGPHVYNNQAVVHGDIYSLGKIADYRKTQVAEAVARAKAEIASRGLTAVVVQNYYGMVSSSRKLANAQQSLAEAREFLDITQKQERGGEVAHSDVVKAQIQVEQRQRDAQEAQLGLDKARLAFSVLLFPDFRQDFAVVDDLDTSRPLPPLAEVQELAGANNPDIRAAAGDRGNAELGNQVGARGPAAFALFRLFLRHQRQPVRAPRPRRPSQLRLRGAGPVEHPASGPGAPRAARSGRPSWASSRPATTSASPSASSWPTSMPSTWRPTPPASRSPPCAIRWTLPPTACGSPCCATRPARFRCWKWWTRNPRWWMRATPYDDGLVRYRLALANLQTLTGAF